MPLAKSPYFNFEKLISEIKTPKNGLGKEVSARRQDTELSYQRDRLPPFLSAAVCDTECNGNGAGKKTVGQCVRWLIAFAMNEL